MQDRTGSVATSIEEWRAVPDYEGSYEVSDQGRVRSLPRLIHPRDGHTRSHPGRVLKPSTQKAGYRQVSLGGVPGRKYFLIHQLVLTTFVGSRPEGMEGCHGDGNPANNILSNLRWDTSTANHHDMVRHGTHHHSAKKVCRFGHRLELPNLVRCKLPWRGCRACALARSKVHAARTLYGRELDYAETANSIYARLEWAS